MSLLSPLSPSIHHNNFNLLRHLLASLVLVAHAPELRDGNRSHELLTRLFGTISFGEAAVACFFVLSGYLITGSWEKVPNVRRFIENRVRRIVPGFVVAFCLSVWVAGALRAADASSYLSAVDYSTEAKDLVQLKPPVHVPATFVGHPYPTPNGSLWTIEFEVRMYALALIIGLLAAGWRRWVWLAILLSGLGLLLLPGQVAQMHFPGQLKLLVDPTGFFRFMTYFAAGACFRLFQLKAQGKWAVVAAAVLLLGLSQPAFALMAVTTAGAYLLFWFGSARLPALSWFQQADDVSYGIYLYGWPVQKLLDWYFPGVSLWLLVPMAWVACCGLGYVSWNLIEKPFLQHKPKPLAEAVAA